MKSFKLLAAAAFLFLIAGGISLKPAFPSSGSVTIHMTASIVKIVQKDGKTIFEGGWDPRKITVQEGTRVTLIVTSVDADHSFYLPEYNLDTYIPAGGTVTIQFTANKPGVFQFRCGDETRCGATHRFMVGELIVNGGAQANAGGVKE